MRNMPEDCIVKPELPRVELMGTKLLLFLWENHTKNVVHFGNEYLKIKSLRIL